MSYIGSTPTTQSFIAGTDYFSGTGSQTAFTLSRSVVSVNDIQATVNNVVQQPNDAYTISGTTITFTSAPSAGTNNVYVRYLSTTTQTITPSQNTVSWNTLDSNTQQDLGLMYKNKIINGNMVIDQRNAGASVTASVDGQYTLDRWSAQMSAGSKYSVQQNAGSVTPPAGFTNYLGVTSLAATSLGSTDYYFITQKVEGYNAADLAWGTANAKTVTFSFWVRSSLTGTFGAALTNTTDAWCPLGYTINSANTWEFKTITVVGPTIGTWNTTNGSGPAIRFSLGIGSTYSGGTSGTWTSSIYSQVSGSTSVVGTNGATFYLTGVQLEVGTQATAFSTAGGSYGAELALCQRYYSKSSSTNVVAVNNAGYTTTGMFTSGVTTGYGNGVFYTNFIKYPTTMRTEATVNFINTNLPNSGTAGQWSVYTSAGNSWVNTGSIGTQSSTTEGFGAYGSFVSGTSYMYFGAWTASAEL